jgi:hypothetical protein
MNVPKVDLPTSLVLIALYVFCRPVTLLETRQKTRIDVALRETKPND